MGGILVLIVCGCVQYPRYRVLAYLSIWYEVVESLRSFLMYSKDRKIWIQTSVLSV
jgi:hypothetical protein